MICAGCGKEVVPSRAHPGPGHWFDGDRLTVCSAVFDTDRGVLLSADYHYVEGEVQRHYPPSP